LQRAKRNQRRMPTAAKRSRRQDRRRQVGMLLFGILGLILIASIPVYGYYDTFVSPYRSWIVKVNDETFTMGYLVKLLRMQQAGSEATGQSMNLGSKPFDLVNLLAENELISQAAPRYKIEVTAGEIDTEIRRRIIGAAPMEETSPEQVEREFQERYRFYLNRVQLSQTEHRQIVRYELLNDELLDHLGQEIPIEMPQVRLYSIPVKDQGEKPAEEIADEIRTAFARGVSFPELVKQFAPSDVVRKEGEVGWMPRGISPASDPLLFDELTPCENPKEWLGCQISEPVTDYNPTTSEFSLTIYVVREKSNLREVEDRFRTMLKTRSLDGWLAEEKRANDVQINFNSDRYSWVIEQLNESKQRR